MVVFVNLADNLYSEALESVLFSFATFSFHPGFQLLRRFAGRVMENPAVYSPLHLANILWCFALFDFCELDLWNSVVNELSRLLLDAPGIEIPPAALYRVYQVHTRLISG